MGVDETVICVETLFVLGSMTEMLAPDILDTYTLLSVPADSNESWTKNAISDDFAMSCISVHGFFSWWVRFIMTGNVYLVNIRIEQFS